MDEPPFISFNFFGDAPPGFDERKVIDWIVSSVEEEKKSLVYIEIIFCDDDYLLHLNQKYLQHDTLTDIITFNYSEDDQAIQGELYISLQRVKENAETFEQTFLNETHRVIIHGILHLVGYNDSSQHDKEVMTAKENYYLSWLS